jgi:hypothetical protein
MTPEQISNQFSIDGTVATIKPFGNGLINTTYKVRTSENDSPNYLLQIVNHHIFKNVPELTRNIERVTSHIREKLEAQGAHDIDRRVLTPVKTNNGEGFYKDDGGNYWRMFLFIEGAHSYDQLTNIKQAEAGGRAFGQFQKLVSDLPGEPLYPVIPGFHDTEMRIKNFNERVNENPVGRLEEVQQDVNFLLERSDEYKKIIQDENDEVLCVIDLDTVMPGYVCYDIGDAIRNGANTGKEDDPNLDNVGINMELFEGFIKGFLQETNGILTREEKETLAFGAKLLTYEQAVRFMDDFLDGDKYYKTDSVKHNLIRARAQIKLLKSMEENFDRMEEIVSRYV